MTRPWIYCLLCVACGATPRIQESLLSPGGGGLGVVNSDYSSTVISLVDPNTFAVRDACVTSGSQSPVLVQALSGDVVLPSHPQASGELTVIDRSNTAVLFVDPATCTPRRQMSVGQGFFANPHDVVSISPRHAFVTRFAPNPDAAAPALQRGADILVIDPQAATLLGTIDVSAYAGRSDDGTLLVPRPDRGVHVDGTVFVLLNRSSIDFKQVGHGVVIAADASSHSIVGSYEVPGTACANLVYHRATARLAVGCAGAIVDRTLTGSLVALYGVNKQRLAPLGTLTADGAVNPDAIALTQSYVYFVTTGANDTLWQSVVGGAPRAVRTASGPYLFGSVFAPYDGSVFVADAAAPVSYIYVLGGTEAQRITAAPQSGLPSRMISQY